MYGPRQTKRRATPTPAAIALFCSICALLAPFSGSAQSQPQGMTQHTERTSPRQPAFSSSPATAYPSSVPDSVLSAQAAPAQHRAIGAPAAPQSTAAPKNPAGGLDHLYNWDNSQGINWNTAVKSEQQVIADFQAKVKQAILNASAYPPLIGKQADKSVELAIQINANGAIGEIDVNNSSGHKQFDAAIMLAAKRVSEPLIPPHGRAITLLIVFKNSELGKAAPETDSSANPSVDQSPAVPPFPTTSPSMQPAPDNK